MFQGNRKIKMGERSKEHMREASKRLNQEIKRLNASFKQINAPKKVKKGVDLNNCLVCKTDAGKNFLLVYKKDNTLKGKWCKTCQDKKKKKQMDIATTNFTPTDF